MKRSKNDKRSKAYRDGETRVYFYDAEQGTVIALDSEGKERSVVLESLLQFFEALCITTNLEESVFSASKILINFRGRRSVSKWKEFLNAFFISKSCPEILQDALKDLEFTSIMVEKSLKS
nr:hypothetical protein [Candidatus Sigynarchaeota archaeon]